MPNHVYSEENIQNKFLKTKTVSWLANNACRVLI